MSSVERSVERGSALEVEGLEFGLNGRLLTIAEAEALIGAEVY